MPCYYKLFTNVRPIQTSESDTSVLFYKSVNLARQLIDVDFEKKSAVSH